MRENLIVYIGILNYLDRYKRYEWENKHDAGTELHKQKDILVTAFSCWLQKRINKLHGVKLLSLDLNNVNGTIVFNTVPSRTIIEMEI